MATLDEAQLARAAAAGDGQAFARLYDEYEGRIYNFCLRLVGGPEDAADATQDAFLKVLQRLPRIPQDRELNFGAYLFTAARNASYDVIGRRKRADPVDLIPESGARPLDGDERGALDLDPERASMLGELQWQVQAANARLPERQREVLALREVEELSYDEIAAIMDMNRNSVAQLISRARIKLRDELQGSALASIAVSSPACERALPLISLRQDGQLRSDEDRAWLEDHVADCATCSVSVEAMHEAGMSYRAWAPVLPAVWLWKATAAKAMDLTGHDWHALLDRPRQVHAGSPSGGGGGVVGGAAAGVAVGSGSAAADAEADATGADRVAATRAASYRRDRRRRAGALIGTFILIVVALLVFLGRQEVPVTLQAGSVDPRVVTTAAPTTPTTPTTPATPVTPTAPGHAGPPTRGHGRTRHHKTGRRTARRRTVPRNLAPAVAAVAAPAVVPVVAPVRAAVPAPAPRILPAAPAPAPAPKPKARPGRITSSVSGTGLSSAGGQPAGAQAPTPLAPPPDPVPAPVPATTPAPAPAPGATYCQQNPTDAKCRPCRAAACRRDTGGTVAVPTAAGAATPAPQARSAKARAAVL